MTDSEYLNHFTFTAAGAWVGVHRVALAVATSFRARGGITGCIVRFCCAGATPDWLLFFMVMGFTFT